VARGSGLRQRNRRSIITGPGAECDIYCCRVGEVIMVCCSEKIGLGSSQLEKLALRATEKTYGKTDGSELQLLK